MKFLTSGKVKDVYELDDDKLLFKFSNRVSAYDVKFKDEIPKKGEVLCKFAEYWFNKLGISSHFEERRSDTEIVVRKLNMLPIECVVRGYFYGSLVSRWNDGKISLEDGTQTDLATKLPSPIFDPTTKSTHDMPVNKEEAISQKLVTSDEYDWLSEESIKIYEKMARIADNAGFILADLKLEFGRENYAIILADSIGPDEFRLWPKDTYKIGKTQEAYDKQLLRDWLTENGYQKKFDDARSNGEEPIAPSIPSDLVSKITQRYVTAYERLTGNTL
uniref:Phosphoribosylaminoimidazole-succinocarboxamide synthase n=1 Tax=uncultured marine thaumarchaeote KM3_76_D06 TaxID=1456284 RepID=A0A075HTI8_9ARCH|nr:phosphoribosylaminoimidazolesuccinocarboxamide synthase (purC) [uncultured marine thaumarchaeote KM3_76_D06]